MKQNYTIVQTKVEGLAKNLPSTQHAFETSFAAEIQEFVNIISTAHRMTIDDVKRKGLKYKIKTTMATLMNGNIKGLLFDRYTHEMKESKSGRFYLHREKECILLFKKLDWNLKPSNITTGNSERILAQLSLDFEDYLPIVFVGFTVDKTWERITNISAVYIKDGKKVWVSDLLALTGAVGQADKPLDIFSPQSIEDEEIVIKTKNTKKDSQKAS